jgi:2-polyprenyl-3-methyl-5-hydroxy-6-metoxy-1,4-benzoquinol methylase
VTDWSSVSLSCPRCRGRLRCGEAGALCLACGAPYVVEGGVLDLRVGPRGAAGFRPEYFEQLERFEHRHFWFAARRRTVLRALRQTVPDLARRRLVDVGCGGGSLTSYLAENGVPLAAGCDAYPEALVFAHRRLASPLVLVDEGRLVPLGPGQELVGMFDVLEHMDDDLGTLSHLASLLAPGGIVALTVPAHAFLFDEMDVLACHRRRYEARELRATLEKAGLETLLLSHFMASLVPLLVAARIAGRFLSRGRSPLERRAAEFRPPAIVNGLLGLVLSLERLSLGHFPLPVGSSLIAVARRRAP